MILDSYHSFSTSEELNPEWESTSPEGCQAEKQNAKVLSGALQEYILKFHYQVQCSFYSFFIEKATEDPTSPSQ